MIRPILAYPDPRLREISRDVTAADGPLDALVDDMAETMYAAEGCGLAAAQIGVNLRVFVIDIAAEGEPSALQVFVNPEILDARGVQTFKEGCLSFPGVSAELKRSAIVRVRASRLDGTSFELEAEGLMAVALQHEFDHLDGMLLIDRVSRLKRAAIGRQLKQAAAAAG